MVNFRSVIMNLNSFWLKVIVSTLINSQWMSIYCDRMTEKIYENIEVESFCFRRLNATHQTGCASHAAGNVGVIHLVSTEEDLDWVTQNGPHFPYIAALNEDFFNMGNMTRIRDSKRVLGVLVLKSSKNPVYPDYNFSPEKSCPNENFGMYTEDSHPEYSHCRKGAWNPPNAALGMLHEDWGIPVVLVSNDSHVEYIKTKCYEKFNEPKNHTARDWPLCAAEVSSFMFAAKDSPTCIRRSNSMKNLNPVKYCEPLGGRNIVTLLHPTNKNQTIDDRSIVLIAARMDAVSMFDNMSPGADSSVSGLVTLLSIIDTINKMKNDFINNAPTKNILFSIFNGETFDYIGSSRAVFDMERGVFPNTIKEGVDQLATIKLHHISHFIEINQVALHEEDTESKLWIHTDPVSTSDARVKSSVENLIRLLKKSSSGINYKEPAQDNSLPPASVQRFLKKDKNISSIVISNFDQKFSNKFFMSQYDVNEYLSNDTTTLIANLCTSVSKAVYELVTSKTAPDIQTNITMVNELMDCYLRNGSCRLFKEIEQPGAKSTQNSKPYSLYVGVDRDNQISLISLYTRFLVAYFSGEELVDRVESNCTAPGDDKIYQYDWMSGPHIDNVGVCIRSIVKFTSAVSPAVVLDDWESKEYSTWTESIWTPVTLRIFLRPNPSLEGLTLGVGFAIFICSLLFVYSVNKRSAVLFGSRALVAC